MKVSALLQALSDLWWLEDVKRGMARLLSCATLSAPKVNTAPGSMAQITFTLFYNDKSLFDCLIEVKDSSRLVGWPKISINRRSDPEIPGRRNAWDGLRCRSAPKRFSKLQVKLRICLP